MACLKQHVENTDKLTYREEQSSFKLVYLMVIGLPSGSNLQSRNTRKKISVPYVEEDSTEVLLLYIACVLVITQTSVITQLPY